MALNSKRELIAVGSTLALVFCAIAWVFSPKLFSADIRLLKDTTPTVVVSEGILISDFNDASEWKYDASDGEEEGGSVSEDPSSSVEGLSIRLATPRKPGSSAWMTLSGLHLDVSDSGTFSFWVNIADPKRVESIAFYLTTDEHFEENMKNYFAGSIDVRGALPPGPQMVAIGIHELQPHGNITIKDSITAVQLRIESKAGDGAASFDHLYYQRRTTPKIVISFDDNWLTQYTEAFPFMAKLGIPGTIYAICDSVGIDRYMSLKQLKAVYAAGWDVGNHTTDHMGFNSDADPVPLLWGRKLRTIANRQMPTSRFNINGSLAKNGRAILSPERLLVFRSEESTDGEDSTQSWVKVEGVDKFGQDLTEIVPLTPGPWITSNNEFSAVNEMTLLAPIKAPITVGVSQAGNTTVTSLIDCAKYLVANGMPRAAYHVAYPMGEHNSITGQAMTTLGFKTGRTVSGRTTPVADGLINPFTIHALAPNVATPLEEAKHMVDQAILHGASAHVVFHRIEREAKVPTDWSVDKFRAFIAYVAEKRDAGLIEPATVSSWYNSLPRAKGHVRSAQRGGED